MRPITSRHSSPLTVVPQQCMKEVKPAEKCPASLVGDAELLASAVTIHPTSSDLEDVMGLQGRGGETRAQVQGWLVHLLCKPLATRRKRVLNKRECVRVAVAAIHQYYCVTLHGGRFTAVSRGADWKRNEQSVLVAQRVHHPPLLADQVKRGGA